MDLQIREQELQSDSKKPITNACDRFFPDFITFLRHHIAHNDNQRVT